MTLSHNEKGLIRCIRRIKRQWDVGYQGDVTDAIEEALAYADHVEERERADWVDVNEDDEE